MAKLKDKVLGENVLAMLKSVHIEKGVDGVENIDLHRLSGKDSTPSQKLLDREPMQHVEELGPRVSKIVRDTRAFIFSEGGLYIGSVRYQWERVRQGDSIERRAGESVRDALNRYGIYPVLVLWTCHQHSDRCRMHGIMRRFSNVAVKVEIARIDYISYNTIGVL